MSDTAWTERRVEMLKKLNGEGSSAWIAAQINAETGACFSRNAIIGKRLRLGLIVTRSDTPKNLLPRKRRQVRGPIRFNYWNNVSRSSPDLSTLEQVAIEPLPANFLGVDIFKLEPAMCHYPRGEEPPFLFCGQPVQANSSYCPSCHARVWVSQRRCEPRYTEAFARFVGAA